MSFGLATALFSDSMLIDFVFCFCFCYRPLSEKRRYVFRSRFPLFRIFERMPIALSLFHSWLEIHLLWSPYVIGQTIIFSCCGLFFFLLLSSLWSPYGIGQTIIFSCCGLFFLLLLLLLFFLAYSQPPQIGCLPYFGTWCGPSVNLECRSETCCARLAGNTGRKKSRQKSPSRHHRTNLSGHIFATKACIDNRKKTC